MEHTEVRHEGHLHGSGRLYGLVLACLLALTVITVLAADIHFGSTAVNIVIALAIASAKASLVALFFMHLRWDKPINALIFVSTLGFLALLLILCLVDFDTRARVIPRHAQPTSAPATVPGTAEGGGTAEMAR